MRAVGSAVAGLLVAGLSGPPAEASGPVLPATGTVVRQGALTCWQTDAATWPAGMRLTVASMSGSRPLLDATVAGGDRRCGAPGLAGYRLRMRPGGVAPGEAGIGIAAAQSAFQRRGDGFAASLPGFAQPVTLRACPSADGVHLTIWQGAPLTGARLWHRYVYLGQDLEPGCQAADVS